MHLFCSLFCCVAQRAARSRLRPPAGEPSISARSAARRAMPTRSTPPARSSATAPRQVTSRRTLLLDRGRRDARSRHARRHLLERDRDQHERPDRRLRDRREREDARGALVGPGRDPGPRRQRELRGRHQRRRHRRRRHHGRGRRPARVLVRGPTARWSTSARSAAPPASGRRQCERPGRGLQHARRRHRAARGRVVGRQRIDIGTTGYFSQATAINDAGQVVGFRAPEADPDGQTGFLWKPAPRSWRSAGPAAARPPTRSTRPARSSAPRPRRPTRP